MLHTCIPSCLDDTSLATHHLPTSRDYHTLPRRADTVVHIWPWKTAAQVDISASTWYRLLEPDNHTRKSPFGAYKTHLSSGWVVHRWMQIQVELSISPIWPFWTFCWLPLAHQNSTNWNGLSPIEIPLKRPVHTPNWPLRSLSEHRGFDSRRVYSLWPLFSLIYMRENIYEGRNHLKKKRVIRWALSN